MKRTTAAPTDRDDLMNLSAELAAVAHAHHAETAQLREDADRLIFGRPRTSPRLKPATTGNLFQTEPQRRLF